MMFLKLKLKFPGQIKPPRLGAKSAYCEYVSFSVSGFNDFSDNVSVILTIFSTFAIFKFDGKLSSFVIYLNKTLKGASGLSKSKSSFGLGQTVKLIFCDFVSFIFDNSGVLKTCFWVLNRVFHSCGIVIS